MTNDFHLFGDQADPSLDADVALIAAYVARELSTVQIMALQERLASDAAFRTTMQQVIDGWVMRGDRSTITAGAPATSLTGDEIEEGWQRHLATRAAGSPATARPSATQSTRRRSWSGNRALRAAAVIVMIVLPVLAIAQFVRVVGAGPGRGASGTAGSSAGQDAATPTAVRVNEGRAAHALPLTEAVLPPNEQQPGGPTPRALGAVEARSPVTFPFVDWLIPFSNGQVVMFDWKRRQGVLLDPALREVRVVLDSVPGLPNSLNCPRYGSGGGSGSGRIPTDLGAPWTGSSTRLVCFMMPFRGDSAQSFDPTTGLFSVIGPDGSIARTYPVPIGFAMFGHPGTQVASPTGLIWRSTTPPRRPAVPAGTTVTRPDTAVVLRMNYDSRHVDTVARIEDGSVTTYSGARGSSSSPYPAFAFRDAVLASSDGSVVTYHAREYRFDWLLPDGRLVRGPKLPDPRPLVTAGRRRQLVDSINDRKRRLHDSVVAAYAASGRVNVSLLPPPQLISEADVPDRLPISVDYLRVDPNGRVWIPSFEREPAPFGQVVWTIVDRTTGVVDRVRMPGNQVLLTFGPGVVYTVTSEGPNVYRLERTKIR